MADEAKSFLSQCGSFWSDVRLWMGSYPFILARVVAELPIGAVLQLDRVYGLLTLETYYFRFHIKHFTPIKNNWSAEGE